MSKTLMMASLAALLAVPAVACDYHTAQAGRLQLAQNNDAARPARGPQSQVSQSADQAPPATTGNTTAATDQSPKVKQMNETAASKTSKEGK